MQDNNPLVSILIITMNHEQFIEQACQSAISQSYSNKEIIFLDNISRDNTAEIAKKILDQSNIPYQFIRNTESYGVAKNLNLMVARASGEFVAILSGDDWWFENLIEEKVNFIRKENVDLVFSDGYKFIQETGEVIPAYAGNKKKIVIKNLDNFFECNITDNQTVNVGTFIRKKLLTDYPFDEEIQTEDWDMNLRMSKLGYNIGFIDMKLFYYRIISTSLSRKWDIMLDSYYKVTGKYLDFINSKPNLKKKHELNVLFFKYQILLSNTKSEKEKQTVSRNWKKEKYKLKYKQPLLFFKLFFLK